MRIMYVTCCLFRILWCSVVCCGVVCMVSVKITQMVIVEIKNVSVYNNCATEIDTMKSKCPVCKKQTAVIIGHCKYCSLQFCLLHRLPETHNCSGIEVCRKELRDRNTAQLLASKCIASKI